jgi:methylmalonyl-CoA/ethylmalonyl-CoA epimerase
MAVQSTPVALQIKRIDHVAVCVADIDEAIGRYRTLLGIAPGVREVVESQQAEIALLPIGSAGLELVMPRGNASLARFLERRGPGLHHVAIEIEGIDEALALLKSLGVPLIDSSPRTGARGHKVAFVHPSATGGVLIELVESSPAGPQGSRGSPPTVSNAPGGGPSASCGPRAALVSPEGF